MSLSKKELCNVLEAALFSAETALSLKQLQLLFPKIEKPSREEMLECISALRDDYAGRGVELTQTGTGYRFQTKPEYADWLRRLHEVRPPRYSRALLETLAIIAYRQPVTRGDIEDIRGVTVSTDIMRVLLDREWVRQAGVRPVPGHPALYTTTPSFLGYFGLKSLDDLPQLDDPRAIGEIANDLNLNIGSNLDVLGNNQSKESETSTTENEAFTHISETVSGGQSSQRQVTGNVEYDDVDH